jgi:hypothetical protein
VQQAVRIYPGFSIRNPNPETPKSENPKTRKPENPKTRKPENPKTRKPENPKTRKPETRNFTRNPKPFPISTLNDFVLYAPS